MMGRKKKKPADKKVTLETGLKELFVQYVGAKLSPTNGEVTVEMCVDVFAEEFPDFLMLVAEENFMRGYKQALQDSDELSKAQSHPIRYVSEEGYCSEDGILKTD